MNRTKIKNYAPRARRDFIQAVTDRAAFFGLTAKKTEPIVEQGDLAIIGGRPFPKAVAGKRKRLEERIKRDGFEQTMEALAYTWFNRLVAIRYMELHGYLDHGYRVLSAQGETIDGANGSTGAPAKSTAQTPELLAHAEHLDLPGLDRQTVIDLKLAGDKEAELYRMLLVAQCNALHAAMPFLFERIDDETELVLPENLLHSDSLIRKLVGEIDEQDWQEVEIIGWIYQFYISEKKDQVIGKVVKSEDIPAATQLFTPNWIVKYLVQNSLGRQWLEHHPDSPLKSQMEYYIEPAEQTPEVQAQLQEIIRKRATDQRGLNTDENSSSPSDPCSVRVPSVADLSLDPEKLTLLDPACGSGHILVEAYDLFKAIYQERGYNRREIPRLILEKNLYGLEIDDRAAQLASLALMMKARADDRRIFDRGVKPNVVAFQESKGLDAKEIYHALASPLPGERFESVEPPAPEGHLFEPDDNLFTRTTAQATATSRQPAIGFSEGDIASLLNLFENAKTFGSLTQVPSSLAPMLPAIANRLNDVLERGDLTQASGGALKPFLHQVQLLARQYDAIAANPPYMGSKYYAPNLKRGIARHLKIAKGDLYSCFIARALMLLAEGGSMSMITLHNWLFLPTWGDLRAAILTENTVNTLVHIGRGVWGSDFPTCCFNIRRGHVPAFRGLYMRLFEEQGTIASNADLQTQFLSTVPQPFIADSLAVVPGKPFAYWLKPAFLDAFETCKPLGEKLEIRAGITTGDNDRYVRFWFEVPVDTISFRSPSKEAAWKDDSNKWFPLKKGGAFRKWYGNNDVVIRFDRQAYSELKQLGNSCASEDCYFRESLTWSDVSTGTFGVRYVEQGAIFSTVGHSIFGSKDDLLLASAILCSPFACEVIRALNPTWHANPGDVANIPLAQFSSNAIESRLRRNAAILIDFSLADWNENETAPGFHEQPLLQRSSREPLREIWGLYAEACTDRIRQARLLEEENSRTIIAAYGLSEITRTDIAENEITMHCPNREEDIKRLISYAVGCMMGRYSLDKPGLIYAHSGNEGFDPNQYVTFAADDDGLVPLLESDWGIADDAANRLAEFINACWPGTSTTDNTDATDDQTPFGTPLSVPSVKSVVNSSPHLEENLQFIAESLGPTRSEQPRDTIRRYLATGFYKHHLSMYKRRPIYWLFTSGKLRAFQCLVYLHRYNEGTLSRMRTEYVIPLQGKLAARADQLATEITAATSTSHRKKLEKERDKLIKQQVELQTFDEKLRHYADRRITLDLDDGVKVNYAKFGDLLAEVKAVTGAKA